MVDNKVYFNVTFSVDDVLKVIELLLRLSKKSEDAPIKMVGLALTVAELEVLRYKGMMSEFATNVDEIIEGLRSQARDRASYLDESCRQASLPKGF
jgi:hypothetical protein